jgi:hypothetical protein
VSTAEPSSVDQPLTLRALITESYRERFVEIFLKGPDRMRLVTAIEVLSPAKKAAHSQGREQ